MDYVYQIIEEQATRHTGNDITFLLGDLNISYDRGGTHNLNCWPSASWWQNDLVDHSNSHQHTVHTKYRNTDPVSWIDHILYLSRTRYIIQLPTLLTIQHPHAH